MFKVLCDEENLTKPKFPLRIRPFFSRAINLEKQKQETPKPKQTNP